MPEMTPAGHFADMEKKVLGLYLGDKGFRERLLANPKAALAEIGLDIPADINVSVLSESPTQYYLVLPDLDASVLSSSKHATLSDAEIEAVVGGKVMKNEPAALMSSGPFDGFYDEYDSKNQLWTGCASGQSGCVATNGCTAVARLAQGAASGGTGEALAHCEQHMHH